MIEVSLREKALEGPFRFSMGKETFEDRPEELLKPT